MVSGAALASDGVVDLASDDAVDLVSGGVDAGWVSVDDGENLPDLECVFEQAIGVHVCFCMTHPLPLVDSTCGMG